MLHYCYLYHITDRYFKKKIRLVKRNYSTFWREFAAIRNKVQLTAIEGRILGEIRRRFSPQERTEIIKNAEGGTRTLTLLPGRDFESRASANSATSAIRGILLPANKTLSTKNSIPQHPKSIYIRLNILLFPVFRGRI